MQPRVSFIVPVYGVEKYLPACLDSIKCQSLTDWECLLIDDGSPDRSGSICDDYASVDERFHVIHKANAGVSAARNDGIALANGRWLYFVDSDDWLDPDAAGRLVEAAEAYDADCVMSYAEKVFEDGRSVPCPLFTGEFLAATPEEIATLQKYVLYQPYAKNSVKTTTNGYAAPWAKFIKAEIVKENKVLFDPYLRGVFDDGLWSLQLLDHVKRLRYIDAKTYNYRIIGGSLTNSFKPNAMETQERGYERIEEWLRSTEKDVTFYEAYYAHVVSFFGGYLSRYFFHPDNKKSPKEIEEDISEKLSRHPFSTAAQKVDKEVLLAKDRFLAFCERRKSIPGLKLYLFARNINPR